MTIPNQAFDVVIGSTPFVLDPSRDYPFRIKSIGQTLYRYDTSNQAGEQTLGAWWLRSQTSYHAGAGETDFDGTDPTISADIASLRFNTCRGVDVWTPGEVKLLADVTQIYSSTRVFMPLAYGIAIHDSNTSVCIFADGSTLYYSDGSTPTTLPWGGTAPIARLAIDDTGNYYVGNSEGIYSGILESDGAGSLLWSGSTQVYALAWVKDRLMAVLLTVDGLGVYELDGGYVAGSSDFDALNAQWGKFWDTSSVFAVGDVIDGGNGHWYKCTTAGTSAATHPSLTTTSGGTTTDGTVVWTEQGTTVSATYGVSITTTTGETVPRDTTINIPSAAASLATYPVAVSWTLNGTITYTGFKIYGRGGFLSSTYTDDDGDFSFSDDGTITPGDAEPTVNTTDTLPAPKFTLPPGWTVANIIAGPEAIYVPATNFYQSVIYKFVLDDSGGIPTLSTGIAALTMPKGIVIYALENSADSWVGIGTNKGLYIGQFQSGGDIAMDLTYINLGGTVAALTAHDRFFYATYTDSDGLAAIARVDLSLQVKGGLYAWAPDLRTADAGEVTQLGLLGNSIVFCVGGKGVYVQSANYVSSGTIQVSRVRFDTSEAKIFDSVRWHGSGPGSVACSVAIDADTGGTTVGTFTTAGGFDSLDVPIDQDGGTYATLTFTLSTTDTTKTPLLNGWLLKALPMQSRSYQIQLPLSCLDFERLRDGSPFGHAGWGMERLADVQTMADEQAAQTLQYLGPKGQRDSLSVVIDDLEYIQTLPPSQSSRGGGLLYLTLRTV